MQQTAQVEAIPHDVQRKHASLMLVLYTGIIPLLLPFEAGTGTANSCYLIQPSSSYFVDREGSLCTLISKFHAACSCLHSL